MKLLNVKHYRQKPGFCGPASLKIVFGYFGVDATEAAIGKAAGCTAKIGTSHAGMAKAAKTYGFKTEARERASLRDLEIEIAKKTPVIVGWFSDEGGFYGDHYSVVKGIDEQFIYLDDPEKDSPTHKIKREVFKSLWFDFEGKNNEKAVWGWMMRLNKKEESKKKR